MEQHQFRSSDWSEIYSIYRLFILSFKNGNNDPTRKSFDKFHIPLVELKNLYVLINNKEFFVQLLKQTNKKHQKLMGMSWNDHYTAGNLLDFLYHQNHYY